MPEIAKVRYTHDAIIDEILARPEISQGELASQFGFTQGWMSIIVNSDAFKERMAERKGELVDPKITATIEARLDAVARRSLDRLLERLDGGIPLKTSDLIQTARLGVGDRNLTKTNPQTQNNLYVVHLPSPAKDVKEWLAGKSGGDIIDISESRTGV